MADLVQAVLWIVIFMMTVVVHEVCHGLAAYGLGDPTAKKAGRLTLNPLKHIDPLWTVLFPLWLWVSTQGRFFIGMAKPVPVDFSRLKNLRWGMIGVAAAGPLANFFLAGLLSTAWKISGHPLLLYGIYLNLGIAFFNLVPIPPLDGSRILGGILPGTLARIYFRAEPFGFFLVFILYLSGFLFYLIIPAINGSCALLEVPQLAVRG